MGLILRIGLFALLGYMGLLAFAFLLVPLGGSLIAPVFSTFGAAAVANAVTVRIFERGSLADLGLAWRAGSAREFAIGALSGIGAATLVLGGPVLFRIARFDTAPGVEHPIAAFCFVSVILLFGALGEEMLFRGYAFQLLVRRMGPYATILPVAAIFGLAHLGNPNSTLWGLVNTILWGVLLGWAYYRTQALWLPFGLHFGWNFTLPLFGENLSGFTMSVTGHTLIWSVGDLWSGGAYGPEGGVLTTAIVVVLFFGLLRWGPHQEEEVA
jgi:membrane protease YdiL (CAAX protease family)